MPILTYIFVGLELLVISFLDIKTKKISNFWPLLNTLIFIIHLFVFKAQYPLIPEHFVFPVASLLIGFLFYLLKIMGPGDSKYLCSLFLLIPQKNHSIFFLILLIATTIVGSILLLLHLIRNFDKIKKAVLFKEYAQLRGIFGSKFTYAPLILLSWIGFGWKINIFSI